MYITNVKNLKLLMKYIINSKWVNLFEAWLLEFNEKMKKENRHVLLLIDSAGGHNISLELRNKLTNVEVFYLPANTTSVLQPLDQGIIRTFKLYYRKLLVEYLMDLNDNEKEYTTYHNNTSYNEHI
jgi:hypothetical protein